MQRRPTESAHAPVETVLVAAASAALVVAGAAYGGARPLVVASFAMSLFLGVAAWTAWLLRREQHARVVAERRADGLVRGLRSALSGGEEAPVELGDEALDRLVAAVLEQQQDSAERAIEGELLVQQWTGCVQRLAQGDLARDVSFEADDELGQALALLQGRQREFADVAGRIADGDLTVSVEPWSERDVLGYALANMVQGLRSTVGELRHASDELQASASSMTVISSEVSRGMEEVAVQTGQLATGAESQVQVLNGTRADADLAAETARDALARTDEGVQSVELADGTMQSLASASDEVKVAIDSLSERSGRIVDFVGMITTIADQTNLLALHAAIEAARAGEHGRGFAVVADEVRKLAEESQRSAQQIAVLVQEIQVETTRTVEVVERTVEQAADGTRVVGEARAAFEQIRLAIDESSRRVAGIQRQLVEVSVVATNASTSTEAVSAATEETSASMEELDASAATTASLSGVLAEVAGRFRLSSDGVADAQGADGSAPAPSGVVVERSAGGADWRSDAA